MTARLSNPLLTGSSASNPLLTDSSAVQSSAQAPARRPIICWGRDPRALPAAAVVAGKRAGKALRGMRALRGAGAAITALVPPTAKIPREMAQGGEKTPSQQLRAERRRGASRAFQKSWKERRLVGYLWNIYRCVTRGSLCSNTRLSLLHHRNILRTSSALPPSRAAGQQVLKMMCNGGWVFPINPHKTRPETQGIDGGRGV